MLEEAGLIEGRNLYDIANTQVVHHLNQALKANVMFKKDIDYIVKDGKVVIIDEFTGRMMDGRRWSDGLHQAVEAKEGVTIEPENQTLASITFQNYFRMYPKLSGMTGTAMTEAPEFFDIYKMNVVAIPTNVPVLRHRRGRRILQDDAPRSSPRSPRRSRRSRRSASRSWSAPSRSRNRRCCPNISRRKASSTRSSMPASTSRRRISSPRPGGMGAVTIATNMAGRGTDIQLGGNLDFRMLDELPDLEAGTPEYEAQAEKIRAEIADEKQRVLEAGGLFVLGTERHESRRIDNQLRGRSGRQGDPGLSRFYLSLDDDLLRIFGPQTMFSRLMNKNLEDGEAIVSPWISKAIETAQKKVEARNYDIRKQVVEFDDVMNDQRKVIYEQRADIMDAESVSDVIDDMRAETAAAIVAVNCPRGHLSRAMGRRRPQGERRGGVRAPAADRRLAAGGSGRAGDDHRAAPEARRRQRWRPSSRSVEPERWSEVEKQILIQTLDHHWKEHLATLDALRQVIHLRSYAQKKPIDEYKQEAFLLFERLLVSIREEVTRMLMRAQVQLEAAAAAGASRTSSPSTSIRSRATTTRADIDAATGAVLSSLPPLQHPAAADAAARGAGRRRRSAGQPQRAMPVRLGQEVQALPRPARVAAGGAPHARDRPDRAEARLPARRGAGRRRAHRAGAARARRAGRSHGDGARAGQGRARAQAVGRRRVPPRLRSRLGRGHRDDVPRRGAAAHSRRAYRRRADRRQACRARLVGKARPLGLGVRQRRDLLAAADRQGARRRAGPLGQLESRARPRRRPSRRAGRPHRGPRGDEDPRPQFRLRPDDRRSAEARGAGARQGLSHSFDMLGEAAKTYRGRRALRRGLSRRARPHREGGEGRLPQVARHFGQADRAPPALRIYPCRGSASRPSFRSFASSRSRRRKADVHFTIDAEEADRLELQMDVFEALLADDELFANGWGGFGIAIQAYQKRAAPLVRLGDRGRARARPQADGPAGQGRLLGHRDQGRAGRRACPIIRCSRARSRPTFPISPARRSCWRPSDVIYPAFATHNANTIGQVKALAGGKEFEFQRLHGMGEELYEELAKLERHIGDAPTPVRIYAPVGSHKELLAYLVRRLLENGANSSFVNRIADEQVSIDELVRDPVAELEALEPKRNPKIILPRDLFGAQRRNSAGVDLQRPAGARAVAGAAESARSAQLDREARHWEGRGAGRSCRPTTTGSRSERRSKRPPPRSIGWSAPGMPRRSVGMRLAAKPARSCSTARPTSTRSMRRNSSRSAFAKPGRP